MVRQVVDEHGDRRRAQVYQLRDTEPGEPSGEYVAVIRGAYRALDFDETELLRAAYPGGTLRRMFVYGSLKAGFSNHRLLRTARFVGPERTAPEFTMYSLGGFPGVVRGGTTAIEGEVCEVDLETLAALDRLEGHPRFYRRTMVRLEGEERLETYLLDGEKIKGRPVVVSGRWR